MRRASNLWPELVSFENLHRAAYRVLRGKRGQVQAGRFFFDLEGELLRLRRELAGREYEPGGYRTFWISDPKPRLISAASFRDRVVHHALVNVIEPVFERRFIHHSYACRRGHFRFAWHIVWGAVLDRTGEPDGAFAGMRRAPRRRRLAGVTAG